VQLELARPDGTRFTAAVKAEEFPLSLAEEVLWRRMGLKLVEAKARSQRGPVDVLAVQSVRRGSPAARAGLAADDLIRAVNSIEVESVEQLRKVVQRAHPSGRLVLLVQRGIALEQVEFSF
jgi:S1-C subfamily serine protease